MKKYKVTFHIDFEVEACEEIESLNIAELALLEYNAGDYDDYDIELIED